jgi:recombination protein RecT
MTEQTQTNGNGEARAVTPFEQQMDEYTPQMEAALPAHIPVERFKRVVITAINQSPDLAQADRRSLFTSCVRAAQDGLLPDGREAALVIFNTKDKATNTWVKQVQYMPMVGGLIKRMRNSGEMASVATYVVHENDAFEYELGDDPKIEHRPALSNRGKPVAAYAIIKLTNGEILREVMSLEEIEAVRSVSRAKDKGPWVDWWGEMARKTVLRRCSKRAPGSSDLDELMKREDEWLYGRNASPEIKDITPPRPERSNYQERVAAAMTGEDRPAEGETYTLVDEVGEVVGEQFSPAEFAEELATRLGKIVDPALWETLVDNNRAEIDRLAASTHREGCYEPIEAMLADPPAPPTKEKAEAEPEPEPVPDFAKFNVGKWRKWRDEMSDRITACKTLDELEALKTAQLDPGCKANVQAEREEYQDVVSDYDARLAELKKAKAA